MQNREPIPSNKPLWIGRIISALAALFLLADGAAKLAKPSPVVEGTIALGYRESSIVPLGIVLLACTILYVVPRTSLLGAILLTGYLGGAVATHVRVEHPLFTHTLFPVYLGVLIWTGLLLREARLRQLLPLRSSTRREDDLPTTPAPAARALTAAVTPA